jgi:hypothetical protein
MTTDGRPLVGLFRHCCARRARPPTWDDIRMHQEDTMPSFVADRVVQTPADLVWAVVADLAGYARIAPRPQPRGDPWGRPRGPASPLLRRPWPGLERGLHPVGAGPPLPDARRHHQLSLPAAAAAARLPGHVVGRPRPRRDPYHRQVRRPASPRPPWPARPPGHGRQGPPRPHPAAEQLRAGHPQPAHQRPATGVTSRLSPGAPPPDRRPVPAGRARFRDRQLGAVQHLDWPDILRRPPPRYSRRFMLGAAASSGPGSRSPGPTGCCWCPSCC